MSFTHKGYTYLEEVEYEPELTRRYHYAVDSSGDKINLDYTQWRRMTEKAFQMLVELGLIGRQEPTTPWTEETLESFQASVKIKLDSSSKE